MRGHIGSIDPALEPLLARASTIPRVPDVVRARALARARTTAAAIPAATPPEVSPGRTGRFPIAIAASLALILGAAGTAGALLGRRPSRPMAPSSGRATPQPRASVSVSRAAPPPRAQPDLWRKKRVAAPPESYGAEIELLERARAAYAGRDFESALVLLAEHGRRFPRGRLGEEREALRVRSLGVSGRVEEARSAAGAFAARFPRSVLLPALLESVGGAQ
jgi:hypothetical protein